MWKGGSNCVDANLVMGGDCDDGGGGGGSEGWDDGDEDLFMRDCDCDC